MYDEPESNRPTGGVFQICEEPESPNEGAYLRYVMNRNRPMGVGGGGKFEQNMRRDPEIDAPLNFGEEAPRTSKARAGSHC